MAPRTAGPPAFDADTFRYAAHRRRAHPARPGPRLCHLPFDTRTSDETFDARCAIELGVIDVVVGRVPQDELADLRNRVETMAALLVGNRFVDFDRYLDANYAFHEVSCRWPTTARSLRRSDG